MSLIAALVCFLSFTVAQKPSKNDLNRQDVYNKKTLHIVYKLLYRYHFISGSSLCLQG